MKKLAIAGLVAASISGFASAETLTFTGTATESCTFSGTAAGTLTNNATTISSSANADTDVANNSGGFYELTVDPVSSFTSAPVGATLATDATLTSTLSGVNSGATTSVVQHTYTLTNAGADNITVSVDTATVTPAVLAGSYTIEVVVSCTAI